MNNFFDKNIAVLKSRNPEIEPLENRLAETLSVRETPAGAVTAQYGGLSIHSSRDPVKEGLAFAKSVKPGSRVFLYGFGLGYHVEPILERIGDAGSLLVVELNPEILAAAMILRDQTGVLSHPRLHLIFGREESRVAAEISRHMKHFRETAGGPELQVLFHSPSFQCIPKQFERLTNALEVLLIERRAPAVLGDLEDRNYSLNKDIVSRSPGIKTLRGKHRGRPAVLIGAGPSFDNALPYLEKIRDGALLACVDTALPVLLRRNIFPDYIFSLDPQDESFEHFVDYLETPLKLVYTPTANCKIVRHCRGEKFVVFKENHSLFADHDPLMREKGTTRAGGSVSCLGLDCLIQLGCNPIILVGQDCAFSGNRTYSRDTVGDEQFLQIVNTSNTVATVHQEKAREKKRIRVKGYNGSQLVTNQVLYSYLRNIEQIAEVSPETRLYNLFPHGARIEHVAPLGSINEMLKLLSR
ncbi:MAG: motility associated factor glycosyltransferase family protein [Nitrospinales bacterium]